VAKISTDSGDVSFAVDGDADASVVLVLGHGAGSGMDSEFMVAFASGLAKHGLRVVRFNFPYIEAGRRTPDRAPVLEATVAAVAAQFRDDAERLILGGKSMGGRIASQAVSQGLAADGLVFLGYPLHPPGKPDRLRTQHLESLSIPMLFVEGTRDPFCPLETLAGVRQRLGAPTSLVVIDDGDHSFKVRKSSGRSTADAWSHAIDAVAAWISPGTP
jgi:predicted alpha/beta-hydrolase family hydrolase